MTLVRVSKSRIVSRQAAKARNDAEKATAEYRNLRTERSVDRCDSWMSKTDKSAKLSASKCHL